MKKRTIIAIIVGVFYFFSPHAFAAEEILVWEDCVKETRANNPQLISAMEEVKVKKAEKAITESALFPQVNATANFSRAKKGTTSTSAASLKKTSNSYEYGANATQLFFDGFKTISNVMSGTENIKVAQENLSVVSAQIRMNLRTAFVNLLKTQKLIFVAEEIVKIRKDNLSLIALRYDSGLEHRGALLTAEANLAQAKYDLAQTKRNILSVQRQLAQAMGALQFKPMQVKGELIVKDTALPKPSFEGILVQHPSFQETIAKKNAAAFSLSAAYGEFFPEITGSAQTSKQPSSHWPPRKNQWNIGVALNWPLFEGGQRIAKVSQAKALYQQAEENERNTRDTIMVQLEQTWAALQDAMEMVEVQDKILKATEERSRIAQAQYSTGFITFDNWIIIEDDLVKAKKAYLEAQAKALLSEAQWVQAKGEMLGYEK